MAVFTILTVFATILPPLGLTQYRLLFVYSQQWQVLSHFIDEWMPLNIISADFNIYKLSLFLIVSFSLLILLKTKSFGKALWFLPLLPFLFAPFRVIRNVFFGYMALSLLLGFSLSKKRFSLSFLFRSFSFVFSSFTKKPSPKKTTCLSKQLNLLKIII